MYLLLALLGTSSLGFTKNREAQTGMKELSTVEMEQSIFASINRIRQHYGLYPLKHSHKLQGMARLHCINMADYHYLGHVDSQKRELTKRVIDLNLGDWRQIAENVARSAGYKDHADAMVNEWMKSLNHKKNILNKDFDTTGIGVIRERSGYYYAAQVFMQISPAAEHS
jgi:uncharacterized protein YkwD